MRTHTHSAPCTEAPSSPLSGAHPTRGFRRWRLEWWSIDADVMMSDLRCHPTEVSSVMTTGMMAWRMTNWWPERFGHHPLPGETPRTMTDRWSEGWPIDDRGTHHELSLMISELLLSRPFFLSNLEGSIMAIIIPPFKGIKRRTSGLLRKAPIRDREEMLIPNLWNLS